MMEQRLLSELCSICHSQQPRYKCPRCKAQTCSLACYKRHKQRAACNGQRDPAVFVKKSQWATPAGVDHDYNYLKRVERNIDDASNNVQDRGIGVASTKFKNISRAWEPGSSLQKYLVQNRITVEHAPLGMSRQKTNQTRATHRDSIVWTVEWADAQGSRCRQEDCLASKSVEELYRIWQVQRRNAERRAANSQAVPVSQGRSKRRKLESGTESEAVQSGDLEIAPTPANSTEEKQSHDSSSSLALDPEAAGRLNGGSVSASDQPVDTREDTLELMQASHEIPNITEAAPPATQSHSEKYTSTDDASGRTASAINGLQPDLSPTTPIHFYLLRPNTSSTEIVAIPLDSQHSLTESLGDRVVQEYPTIYVLPQGPQELPAGFMLESQYLAKTSEQHTQRPTAHDARGNKYAASASAISASDRSRQASLDANNILDMLKRDVYS